LRLPRFIAERAAVFKGRVGAGQEGISLREGLPAPDRGIDIKWVELEAIAAPTNTLGRQDGRARSHERVEHNVAPPRAVAHRIRHIGRALRGLGRFRRATL
jgi:hypothetical protein